MDVRFFSLALSHWVDWMLTIKKRNSKDKPYTENCKQSKEKSKFNHNSLRF